MPHVLIVDDAPEVCEALRTAFNLRVGWRASTAQTPDDAVAAIERDRPDAAIVEAAPPSGIRLAEAIASRGIPVLLMSGEPETLVELERVGCARLEKPFHLEDLVAETRALLAQAPQRVSALATSLRGLAAVAAAGRARPRTLPGVAVHYRGDQDS